MRITRSFLLIFILMALAGLFPAKAQDAENAPTRAVEAVGALQDSKWEELANSMKLLRVSTALGTRLTAIRFSTDQFKFAVAQQESPKGERAASVLKRTDGELVVNGGFFRIDGSGNLFPVGLLVDEAGKHGAAWPDIGGYLAMDSEGAPAIKLSGSPLDESIVAAVQSRPVLIEPGGQWAMRTNGTALERRTLICLMPDDEAMILIVSGSGLTLFEAGWILRDKHRGGFFGCDAAIALDGGGSTQMAVKDRSDLTISGVTSVQNLIVISQR